MELPRADPLPLSFSKSLAQHDLTHIVSRDPIDLDPSPDYSRNATVDDSHLYLLHLTVHCRITMRP